MLSVSIDTLFIWGNRVAENILIVGNGFDLSHYLPTKYDHFMDVMKAIEDKKLSKPIEDVFKADVDDLPTLIIKVLQIKNALNEKNYEMNFDNLFSECREKNFIQQTKSIYNTDAIKLDLTKIIEIQYELKKNSWYQYFKNHIQDIKTWIDFEVKIENLLRVFARRTVEIQKLERSEDISNYLNKHKNSELKISDKDLKNLNFFGLTVNEQMRMVRSFDLNSGRPLQSTSKNIISINKIFCVGHNPVNGFSADSFIDHLNSQLNEFIKIFNFYLVEIVQKLNPKTALNIQSEEWAQPSKIYSFNYTDTYKKNYKNVKTEYLHGKCGEQQNIVLGVSDLDDDGLKALRAYGFTKYHQKLLKDTDYLFIDGYKEKVAKKSQKLSELKEEWKFAKAGYKDSIRDEITKTEKEMMLHLNISIWGHSLDLSDRDYIKDIFSLNDDFDRNVRVVVYYFDNAAKFALLNNLLAILGKDKVEKWMKKKWLQFKPNPEIKFEEEQQQQIA